MVQVAGQLNKRAINESTIRKYIAEHGDGSRFERWRCDGVPSRGRRGLN